MTRPDQDNSSVLFFHLYETSVIVLWFSVDADAVVFCCYFFLFKFMFGFTILIKSFFFVVVSRHRGIQYVKAYIDDWQFDLPLSSEQIF